VPQDRASQQGPGEFGSESSSLTELLSGVLPQTVTSLNEQLAQLTQGISYLTPASQMQAQALLANTQALAENTTVHGSGGVASALGGIASTLTGGLLSVSPILSGMMSLFGGSGSSSPPPLTPFYLQPTVNFQAANAGGSAGPQLPGADFGQSGQPRAMTQAPAPQITVQVQAMDSRSFMDHSSDIAQAVRDAMLNMHSINDVISNL
jgi:hypothetical protein